MRGRERRELCVIVSTRKRQSENRQAGRSSNDGGARSSTGNGR